MSSSRSAAPIPCRTRSCARRSGCGACRSSPCRTKWHGWSCTSSSIAPIRSVGESPTIAERELTPADRAALLALARRAIEAALCGRAPPELPDVPGVALRRGAFVSLEERETHDLRGCIGHVLGDRPLGEVIRQVAVSAARSDPRFPPVQRDELSSLRIGISVLAEPVHVETADRRRLGTGPEGLPVPR